VWTGSLLFAAFGLFAGYLLPSENVTQVTTLALTLCSFAGGFGQGSRAASARRDVMSSLM